MRLGTKQLAWVWTQSPAPPTPTLPRSEWGN